MRKKRVSKVKSPEITPEALRLWKLVCEIERQGATDRWEDDRRPGRRRDYLTAERALATACGLDWTTCIGPSDAKTETLPANLLHRELQAAAWREARAARLALIEADREAAAE